MATALLFPAIGTFPWIMIGATLIFFDSDWPARVASWLRRLHRLPPGPPFVGRAESHGCPPTWPVRVALVLVALFFAVQVLVPLRHLAYAGDVRWTEEGYRFSWRVLLTEKTGVVRFRMKSSVTDGGRLIYPEEYLTPTQVERMAYQPDLVLATAHIIPDDLTSPWQSQRRSPPRRLRRLQRPPGNPPHRPDSQSCRNRRRHLLQALDPASANLGKSRIFNHWCLDVTQARRLEPTR